MSRAIALLCAAALSLPAAAVTPTGVKRAASATEYSYQVDQPLEPLVVVVPDVTVPVQRVVVHTREPARSCPPAVTQSLAGAALPGGVKSAREAMDVWPFAVQLEKSDAAFEAPETIKLGRSAEIRLVIDTRPDGEAAGSNAAGEVIPISRVVSVKILAPDFTVIEAVDAGRQVLNPAGPTEWRWTVTPKKLGEYKVNVAVSAVIEIGADRAERLVKVFDQEVTVMVTPADAVRYFFSKNWQWLWSTLVLPFGLWVWRRRRQRAAEAIADDC
jgi:hypothetical protein